MHIIDLTTIFRRVILPYNFSSNFCNSYLAYEVVILHHLRSSTGPKGIPLEYFRLCETFFEKKIHQRVSPSISLRYIFPQASSQILRFALITNHRELLL